MSSSSFLIPVVLSLIQGETMLDIGCGYGKWGFLARLPDVEWLGGKSPRYIVGVDVFMPYLRFSRDRNVYDDLVQADIRKLPFREKSFDLVLMPEVLEHLCKNDGYKVLNLMDEVARKRIIITTPNHPEPQGAEHGNVFQIHRSKWTVEEFKRLGYTVKGLGFVLKTRKLRYKFSKLMWYVPWISGIFAKFSEFLVAVKDMQIKAL